MTETLAVCASANATNLVSPEGEGLEPRREGDDCDEKSGEEVEKNETPQNNTHAKPAKANNSIKPPEEV